MRKKVEQHQYNTLQEFERDFNFVWNNAMIYNTKDTIYYRAAVRIRDAGKKILEQVRQQLKTAGVSPITGMHDPDVAEPPPLTPTAAAFIQQQPPEVFTRGEAASICTVCQYTLGYSWIFLCTSFAILVHVWYTFGYSCTCCCAFLSYRCTIYTVHHL